MGWFRIILTVSALGGHHGARDEPRRRRVDVRFLGAGHPVHAPLIAAALAAAGPVVFPLVLRGWTSLLADNGLRDVVPRPELRPLPPGTLERGDRSAHGCDRPRRAGSTRPAPRWPQLKPRETAATRGFDLAPEGVVILLGGPLLPRGRGGRGDRIHVRSYPPSGNSRSSRPWAPRAVRSCSPRSGKLWPMRSLRPCWGWPPLRSEASSSPESSRCPAPRHRVPDDRADRRRWTRSAPGRHGAADGHRARHRVPPLPRPWSRHSRDPSAPAGADRARILAKGRDAIRTLVFLAIVARVRWLADRGEWFTTCSALSPGLTPGYAV